MRPGRFTTLLAAIVLTIVLPGAPLLRCLAGPTASAMVQMECCKHDRCSSAVAAAPCCQRGDHSAQSSYTKSLVGFELMRKLPPASGELAVVAPAPTMNPSVPLVVLFAGTTSPPRLAFSVLLI